MRARLGRLAAAGIATALGVGFMATAGLVLASAHRGLEEAVAAPYVRADLVIEPAGNGLDADDLSSVASTPGVAGSAGMVEIFTRGSWPGSRANEPIVVDSLATDPVQRWQRLTAGAYPSGVAEIAISADEAAARGLGLGDRLTLTDVNGDPRLLQIVGVYTGGLPSDPAGFTADRDATLALDPTGYLNEIVVRVASSGAASAAAVRAAVQAAVGADGVVVPASDHVAAILSGMTSDVNVLGLLLYGFAAVAMFVAALVIANTFAVVLASRSRELALLRCVGATRGQLLRSVLAEAVVVAAGAGAVGVGAGIGLAALVTAWLGSVQTQYPMGAVALSARSLALPLLFGFVVTVLASAHPALRATRVSPLAALRPGDSPLVRSRSGAFRVAAAAGAAVAGGVALVLGTATSSIGLGIGGGAVSFVGVLLAGPLLVPAVVRLLGVLPAQAGVPARLAVTNSIRNPRRTAATCSALLVGTTLIAMMSVGAASLQRSEAAALDAQLPVDLIVDGGGEALAGSVASGVGAIDGVTAMADLAGATVAVSGTTVRVLGIDPGTAAEVVRGSAVADLADGTALVQGSIAFELGVSDGSRLDLGNGVRLSVRLANSLETAAVLVTSSDLARIESEAPLGAVWARVDSGASARAVTHAAEDLIAGDQAASVGGAFSLRADYEGVFDVLLGVATALLAVAVLIALVGVGNTMSLSVVERRREHAMLRAIGLTRGQLAGSLAAESLLLAATAGVLGVGLGIAYGIAGAATLFGSITDNMAFAIPWGRLGLLVLVAAAAGVVASILPARRAARSAPAAALGDG